LHGAHTRGQESAVYLFFAIITAMSMQLYVPDNQQVTSQVS